MKQIERDYLTKKDWGDGPWQNEPDHEAFYHAGLPCILHRNTRVTGSWCGYVAVYPKHPFHKKRYSELEIDIHGGLTYAAECNGDICHKPKPGEPDNVWWFGFDCAHGFDLSPRMSAFQKLMPNPYELTGHETYKDINYAREETKRLAEQLACIGAKKVKA